MPCNHEFIATAQLGVGYCRCRLCLSTFPVSMWAEQLNNKLVDVMKLIGLLDRRMDRFYESDSSVEASLLNRMTILETKRRDFEDKILASLTEPVIAEKDLPPEVINGLTNDGIIIEPSRRKKEKSKHKT